MELIEKLMVKPGSKANLGDWDPDCMGKYENKEQAMPVMEKLAGRIAELQ